MKITQPAVCVICSCRQPRTGMVCDPDRGRLDRVLDEIPDLHRDVRGWLAPGQASGQRVSGSREASLPLRVDPLDLTMPAPTGRQVWTVVHDTFGDQVGESPAAAVLDSWVRDWTDTLAAAPFRGLPIVYQLTRWLGTWLDTACDHHPAVDEFADEVFTLRATLRRTLGRVDPRPERLDAPCARCDARALHRLPGEDRVECGACGRRMTEDEYRQWVGLVVARAA